MKRMILLLVGVGCLVGGSAGAAETIEVTVREGAGIARFGYPVEGVLVLPGAVEENTEFRLLEEGRPVAAQFRPEVNGNGPANCKLNFNVSLLPFEAKTFTVEYGEGVRETPPRRGGLSFRETEGGYRVSHEPHLHWSVGKDLRKLLTAVKIREEEQLRDDSPGLILHGRDGRRYVVGREEFPVVSRVVRKGPVAVDLRFEQAGEVEALPGVRSVIDLQFVNTKSWVRVDWIVEDPQGEVAGLESGLNVAVEQPEGRRRTLVDFGGTSYVYAALGAGQEARLEAGRALQNPHVQPPPESVSWRVLRGATGGMRPFVAGPERSPVYPEGWAHLMDREKCLAIAVEGFARSGRDEIGISGEGGLRLKREFAAAEGEPPAGQKRFRFWLHFVSNPPHISAATSPQSMQNPLEVEAR